MIRTMIRLALVAITLAFGMQPGFAAVADKLLTVRSQADLDAVVASTADAALRQALKDHSAAVLAAAAEHAHAMAVLGTVESAAGKVEKVNTTPESLKKAAGADLPVFDTLKSVDLSVANMGPHDKRTTDPYDADFFAHLSHVTSLESLNIIGTKLSDDWIAQLANLTNLKSLRFTNNGKLSDVGLEKLAGLKNLETFSFVGTGMKGHAFARFEGWTRLTRCSFRGSSIDDEGLGHLCERFPNLESISLAHAKFTDAGAVHLAKLTRLKGLEIGSRNATTACLRHLSTLPLEYLQLGDGLDSPAGIAEIKSIRSLRRVTLTHCEKLSDDGLKHAADLTQLDQLEIGGLPLPDERLPQLQAFSFLKILQLVNRPKGYPPETQSRIKELLPKVDVKFP
jgi:hypothetical protein